MKCRVNRLMTRAFLARALSYSAVAALTLNPVLTAAVASDYRAAPAPAMAAALTGNMNARFLPLGVGKSVVIDLPEVTDIEVLVASIARLAREQNVLRAKGYLAVKGKPMRLLVQSVGERVRHQFDKPWGASPRQSKLVVIGELGDIDEQAIRAGLGI